MNVKQWLTFGMFIIVTGIVTAIFTYDPNEHDWYMIVASVVGTLCALVLVRLIIMWYHDQINRYSHSNSLQKGF